MPSLDPAPRRFRRAPEQKRSRIVAVGRRCFTERGYANTATAFVARHAEVSEGTIFHHFGSKRGLLEAVAQDYARELADEVLDGVEQLEPPALDEIYRRGLAFLEKAGRLGLRMHGNGNAEASRIVMNAIREATIARAARLVDAWQERGLVRPMNARLFCEMIYPAVDQAMVKLFLEGPEAISEAWFEEMRACFAGALGCRAASRRRP